MSQLLNVPFRNTTLQIIEENGNPYVAMRPIVSGMGLSWPAQYRKLMAERDRWGVAIMATPSVGGDQENTCLPLRKIFGWLMTISLNKVKPELRETIGAYQTECDAALWAHWSGEVTGERQQNENYWFARRPLWPLIRARVLIGERYRDIATAIGRSLGSVARAVRRMIEVGLLHPLKVAEQQRGPSRIAALRRAPGWGHPQLSLFL